MKWPKWIAKEKPEKEIPKNPQKMSQKALRIFAGTQHKSIYEAIGSDIIDVIPIAGDVGNAVRVYDAVKKGDSDAFMLQSGDLLIGVIPVIGDIGDLLTPTNTLLYILRKQKLKNKLIKGLP